jgi:hypothetical protein
MSQTLGGQGRGSGGGGGRRKSRIVIDVAQAQAEARARRSGKGLGRGGRILSLVAIGLVALALLVLAGGYAWWRSYAKGPAYSLALLVDAARRDDLPAVEALIDADQIAQGFLPQVIDKLAGGAVALPPQVQRGQLSAALPALIPRLRETMREEITRNMKGIAEQAGKNTPTPLLALGISRMAEIKEEGDAANVAFKSGERPVELALRRNGERWKVVTVNDDALATDIATRLASSLPQGSEPQTPARRRQGR